MGELGGESGQADGDVLRTPGRGRRVADALAGREFTVILSGKCCGSRPAEGDLDVAAGQAVTVASPAGWVEPGHTPEFEAQVGHTDRRLTAGHTADEVVDQLRLVAGGLDAGWSGVRVGTAARFVSGPARPDLPERPSAPPR